MSCKQCKILQEHNRYLQSLIDKLLMDRGISPVLPQNTKIGDEIRDLIEEGDEDAAVSAAQELEEEEEHNA